jgi:hypothetical protein
MPIPLSPNDRFGLVLKSDQAVDDAGKPSEPQPEGLPTFLFRHLSGRQQRELTAQLDELEKQATTLAAIDKTYAILKTLLVGWRNLRDGRQGGAEIEYDPAKIEDVLQYREAQELIFRVWGYSPTAADLGKSSSQSSTPSA